MSNLTPPITRPRPTSCSAPTSTNEPNQVYHQQGPDTFKDDAGKPLAADAAIVRIKKQMHQYAALTEARKDANAFLTTLTEAHDEQHPFTPEIWPRSPKPKA